MSLGLDFLTVKREIWTRSQSESDDERCHLESSYCSVSTQHRMAAFMFLSGVLPQARLCGNFSTNISQDSPRNDKGSASPKEKHKGP